MLVDIKSLITFGLYGFLLVIICIYPWIAKSFILSLDQEPSLWISKPSENTVMIPTDVPSEPGTLKCNYNKGMNKINENNSLVEVFKFERASHTPFVVKKAKPDCDEKDMQQRFPSTFIIGEMKCGTSALMVFMTLHPHIQSPNRELHFFDSPRYYQHYDWYKRQMPYSCPGDVTIEKSPSYVRNALVPERILSFNSNAFFILVVRDPVARAISEYYFRQRHSRKPYPSFRDSVLNKTTGEVLRSSPLVKNSLYVEHLKPWTLVVARKQVLIIDGDQFIKENPSRTLHQIETHVNVQHYFHDTMFYYNQSKGYYCLRYPGCLPDAKGHIHPPIVPQVLQKLRDFFELYNQQFFKLVNMKFDW